MFEKLNELANNKIILTNQPDKIIIKQKIISSTFEEFLGINFDLLMIDFSDLNSNLFITSWFTIVPYFFHYELIVMIFGLVSIFLIFGLTFNKLPKKELFIVFNTYAKKCSYLGAIGISFFTIFLPGIFPTLIAPYLKWFGLFDLSNFVNPFLRLIIYISFGSNSLFYNSCLELFSGYYINFYTQIIKVLIFVFHVAFYNFIQLSCSKNFKYPIELPILIYISSLFAVLLVSINNLALFLLALEGFSLLLYSLTIVERTFGGILAGVKYFAFGTLGSIALLWGLAHFYALFPSLSYNVIFKVTNILNNEIIGVSIDTLKFSESFNFACTLLTVGFFIKLGAAPFHQWVIDVYAGSPTIITTYYSTIVKFIFFILYIRLAYNIYSGSLVILTIILSLLVGCYLSLRQQEIKRLLAASSIVHVAFLLMGDITSSLIYIFVYLMSNFLIFLLLNILRVNGNEFVHINDLKHIRKKGWFYAISFSISLISMAGLPPFAGFFGKFSVWVSLMEDIYLTNSANTYTILFISILISLITIFYYFRIIKYIFLSSDSDSFMVTSLTYHTYIHDEKNSDAFPTVTDCGGHKELDNIIEIDNYWNFKVEKQNSKNWKQIVDVVVWRTQLFYLFMIIFMFFYFPFFYDIVILISKWVYWF